MWILTDLTSVVYNYPTFTEAELLERNNLSRIKGYYIQREFYQPDYDKDPVVGGLPDFRNTLLWAPSVFTDKNVEATLSFFCSDINTAFLGCIEGVGNSGLLGTSRVEFFVQKTKP